MRRAQARRATSAPHAPCATCRIDFRDRPGHGDHRPVGVRQVDAAALPQPDARDGAAARASKGEVLLRRAGHLRARRQPDRRAPAHRHGVPAADAVSHDVDPRQRRRRTRASSARRRPSREREDEIVERALRRAALWDEVKDRLQRQRHRALRRPAAAPLHRARARHATRASSCSTSRPRRSTRSARRRSRSSSTSCAAA